MRWDLARCTRAMTRVVWGGCRGMGAVEWRLAPCLDPNGMWGLRAPAGGNGGRRGDAPGTPWPRPLQLARWPQGRGFGYAESPFSKQNWHSHVEPSRASAPGLRASACQHARISDPHLLLSIQSPGPRSAPAGAGVRRPRRTCKCSYKAPGPGARGLVAMHMAC